MSSNLNIIHVPGCLNTKIRLWAPSHWISLVVCLTCCVVLIYLFLYFSSILVEFDGFQIYISLYIFIYIYIISHTKALIWIWSNRPMFGAVHVFDLVSSLMVRKLHIRPLHFLFVCFFVCWFCFIFFYF